MYTVSGKADKNRILLEHAPLVKRLAYQLMARLPPSVEVDDLIQAGMMGLLDAVNRFEEGHGAQFETYAVQRIRGAMLDELRGMDWLPRSLRQDMRKIEAAMSHLQQLLGRAPSELEIAKSMNLTLAEYQDKLSEGGGHQLVYYEDYQGEGDERDSFLERYMVDENGDPLSALLEEDFKHALIDSIESLPEREKILMGLYYEQEMNLKEIGAIMGVSESRVCQLHSQAIARIRAALRSQSWTGAA